MQKLLLFGLIIATILSCSVDDSVEEEFRFEILPIETVEMPTSVSFNEVITISYTYLKPSTCHNYNDLYFISEGDTKTVAVINTVVNINSGTLCEPISNSVEERSFTFRIEKNEGNYTFRFWQGEDENGQDTYLIQDVAIE